MKLKIFAILLILTLPLGACESQWNKQTMGTGLGALTGGFLGSKVGKGSGQLWTTAGGALIGAYLGSEIGKSLDQADMAYHQQAVEQAHMAPLNQTIVWENDQNGHKGAVTPVREGHQASTGHLCREYQQEIWVDGQSQTAYGVACQNNDGTWTVAN